MTDNKYIFSNNECIIDCFNNSNDNYINWIIAVFCIKYILNKRNFYLEETIKSNWSVRQLERQINSFYYERLLSTSEEHK